MAKTQVKIFLLMFWLLVLLVAETDGLVLQPNFTSTCPGSTVSLECSGAEGSLTWVAVRGADPFNFREVLWRMRYDSVSDVRTTMSREYFGVAGESVFLSTSSESAFSSALNITSREDVSVRCEAVSDLTAAQRIALIHIIKSPPDISNFGYRCNDSGDIGTALVTLSWSVAANESSAPVHRYILYINSVPPNHFTQTIIINGSTGANVFLSSSEVVYYVEITAETCYGNTTMNYSIEENRCTFDAINTSAKAPEGTWTDDVDCSTIADTTVDSRSQDCLQSLSAVAVAGITVAVLVVGGILGYLSGLLTGLLIQRKRKSATPTTASSSGDPVTSSQIVYEEVLPQKADSIPMQENASYGPLVSET